MKSRLAHRTGNERGEINIVSFAVALPILILVGTVSMDIIRYPITQQQIGTAVESAYDALVLEQNENSGHPDPATGRDWCVLFGASYPRGICSECSDPASCTGALDSEGKHAVKLAVSRAFSELTKSGIGVLHHAPKDVTVAIGIYNLVVTSTPEDNGKIIAVETVGSGDASASGGVLNYPFDLKAYLESEFLSETTKLGHFIGYAPDSVISTTDVSVAVFGVAVRVHNVFALPTDLQFGPAIGDDTSQNETLVVTTVVRPLSRGIRLSGQLAPISE